MKIKVRILALVSLIASFAFFFLPSVGFAKEISMYDQPAANGKVVGTVDLATGIIPVFTPKNSDWIKIADPRNGNVGWIKSSDLNTPGAPVTFTYTQKVINDGKTPHTVQMIEYGTPQTMSNEQTQKMLQQMQMRQRAAEQALQKTFQDMWNDMNNLYQHDWGIMNNNHFPVIMPVVFVPASQPKAAATQQVSTPASKPASAPTSTGK